MFLLQKRCQLLGFCKLLKCVFFTFNSFGVSKILCLLGICLLCLYCCGVNPSVAVRGTFGDGYYVEYCRMLFAANRLGVGAP